MDRTHHCGEVELANAGRDTRLYLEDGGSGPTLLFVHGVCGDARVWRGQVQRLAHRFRCIAYDRRGHTRSPRGTATESVTTHAEDRGATLLIRTAGTLTRRYVGMTMETVPPADVVAAIHRASAANPLLRIGIGGLGPGPSVDRLIDEVAAWVGARERRVAASLVVLGYSARLVGATVAILLRDGILLDVRDLRVVYEPPAGFRLALPQPAGWRAPVTRWGPHVVDGTLADLVGAVSAAGPVASGLLWGNVASGVAGALRYLAQSGAVPPEECFTAGSVLLEYGPLRGRGAWTIHNGQLRYTRKSCCLFYRLDGGGLCGDCALLK